MTDPTQTPFPHPLDQTQLRVLGALIEKEITTPEQYPLSLNALINACNQRSSRDPVLDLSEDAVRDALDTLAALSLVTTARDARVPKYEHRIRTVLNLRRDETALLCLLLLRGPQTPGELRARADRMYNFDDLAAVQTTLDRLASRPSPPDPTTPPDPTRSAPLTLQLPRQPGARESRYTHLLGTHTPEAPAPALSAPPPGTITPARLEAELAPSASKSAHSPSASAALKPRSASLSISITRAARKQSAATPREASPCERTRQRGPPPARPTSPKRPPMPKAPCPGP